MAGPGVFADSPPHGPDFARELYAKGYFGLAAMEWARIATRGDGAFPGEARAELAWSLWHSGAADEALRLVDALSADPSFPAEAKASVRGLGVLAHLGEARFGDAGEAASRLLDSAPLTDDLREELRRVRLAGHLVGREVEQARALLDLDRTREREISEALQSPVRGTKSPRLAGTLSAVLPGAGQMYTGRWSDGLIAFTVNALLIATTVEAFENDMPVLGATTAVFASGWYLGNIYSAVNTAHRHNQRMETHRLLDWLRALELGLDEAGIRAGIRFSY